MSKSASEFQLEVPNPGASFSQHTKAIVVIFFLVCLLGFFKLGRFNLVYQMEAWHMLTVQESVVHDNWLILTHNERPRIKKPPLPYWIDIAVAKVIDGDHASLQTVRSISVLMGFIAAVCVYLLGCRMFDYRAGLWAAIVWATCFLAVREYRNARHDIYLTAGCSLAMLGIYKAWLKERFGYLIATLGVIFAFQSKAHLSWIMTLWPAMAYAVIAPPTRMRSFGRWCRLHSSRGNSWLKPLIYTSIYFRKRSIRWKFIGSMWLIALISMLSLAPWLIMLRTKLDPAVFETLKWEIVGRIASDSVQWKGPWLYLLFPGFLFPWAFFCIAGLVIVWEKRFANRRAAMMFCFIWFVSVLCIMLLPKEKKERYIVPLLTPCALLIGQLIAYHLDLHDQKKWDTKVKLLWISHVVVLLLFAIGWPAFLLLTTDFETWHIILLMVTLLALTAGITWSFTKLKVLQAYVLCVIITLPILGGWHWWRSEAKWNHEPYKELGPQITQHVDDHNTICWPIRQHDTMIYYMNRTAPAIGEWYYISKYFRNKKWDFDKIYQHYNSPETCMQLRTEVLNDYLLNRYPGQIIYVIIPDDYLTDLKTCTSPLGYTIKIEMNLTTRRPMKNKTRDPLSLVKLTPGE